MKNLFLVCLLATSTFVKAQFPVIQPLASGDYWRIDEYNNKLREFANQSRSFPTTVIFPSGSVGIVDLSATRLVGANEIMWSAGALNNVSRFYIEYSRDQRNWERAGIVTLQRREGDTYVFHHLFDDNRLVYYRIAVANNEDQIMAYTPSVQLRDEEYSTKIYPTEVRGGTFYAYIAHPFEKLQVVNSAGQSVYEKGIENETGTVTFSLPNVTPGIYFVRLLSGNKIQHVQKILVER